MSFWGEPRATIKDATTAKLIEAIRKLTEKQSRDKRLFTATNAMRAIVHVIAEDFGPPESLAVLDKLRAELTGTLH